MPLTACISSRFAVYRGTEHVELGAKTCLQPVVAADSRKILL